MNGIERLENRIKKIEAGRILDIASGRGNFVYYIKEFNSNDGIFCIDTNEELSKFYDKEFPEENIKFIPMNAYELTFADDSFDSISISNSIHHLEDPEKVFSEMKRVLKKNGTIFINEMFSDNQDKPRNTHTRLHNWWAKIDSLCGIIHHEVFKKERLLEIAKNAFIGFDIETIEYYQPFEDPFADNVLKQMNSYIDMYIERARKASLDKELVSEGEEIRDILYNNGYSPSGAMFLILKKSSEK